jgi:RNA polymerase sigma factor (sigma-70 family)
MLRDRPLREIEAIYRDRYDAFFRVARAITGDRERAAEAVHDAFAAVIRNRRSYRGDGPREAWIWRAVVNAARNATRRPLVEVRPHVDEAELPPAQAELAPYVSALPERQRLVVFLRYYADLDYASIAAALGVDVGTVGSTLAAAHRTLRLALQEVHTQ